ncbi:hypothetical protein LB467_01690 [Salegentibacter sp. JZCK2]|uniref:hypothetical protein n=1 Tax=Salegentibacter tibetensis TaxID=2873600 RepID=UPI001CCC0E14|nr:hypothetical protein [Salegentibacter tibetensis]MBZ9728386.1 hypothetical protein [Salegentibacter tibetensis]
MKQILILVISGIAILVTIVFITAGGAELTVYGQEKEPENPSTIVRSGKKIAGHPVLKTFLLNRELWKWNFLLPRSVFP